MGRVEEALRRAAEDQGAEAPTSDRSGIVDTAFPSENGPDPQFESEFSAEAPPAVAEIQAPPVGGGPSIAADEPYDIPLSSESPARPLSSDDAVVMPASEAQAESAAEEEGATGGETVASGGLSTKLVGDERMLTTSREQYRRLAAMLHHLQEIHGLKVVLIASAVAGEGKTLTAANLALTFSESYERDVLLIDADLRRPSLARTFGIPSIPGLSDGLLRDFDGKLPLQQVSDRLSVLPAGRSTPDPMAGLTSERMKQLVAEARSAFDWVILDTPPIGLMTDASLLASIADGTVLVVKANSTPYDMVRRAVEALGQKRLLGVVLNRATTPSHGDKYYDYYHYAPSGPEPVAAE